MSVTRIGSQRDILGECPLWDEEGQALYWVDIRLPELRFDYASGLIETRLMPSLVGALLALDAGVMGLPEPRWAGVRPLAELVR